MAVDILSMGEAMVEFNAAGPASDGMSYIQGYGGDSSNAAVAAARQGASAGYLSAVGADLFGDALLALWAREGVDTSCVKRDLTSPTGIYFVTHGPEGHAFTYYRAGSAASRIGSGELPVSAISSAKIFHVSGISQAISESAAAAVAHAILIAKHNRVRVSYDTNLRLKLWPLDRARRVIHEAMAHADIALPSLEDARLLTEREDADAIVDFYLTLGPSLVALKLGSDGCLVATASERRRIPGHNVAALDATGAGDTFCGAFLARLVAGDDPFTAGRYANAAAALSTTGYGAVTPIPRREAVENFLRSGA